MVSGIRRRKNTFDWLLDWKFSVVLENLIILSWIGVNLITVIFPSLKFGSQWQLVGMTLLAPWPKICYFDASIPLWINPYIKAFLDLWRNLNVNYKVTSQRFLHFCPFLKNSFHSCIYNVNIKIPNLDLSLRLSL